MAEPVFTPAQEERIQELIRQTLKDFVDSLAQKAQAQIQNTEYVKELGTETINSA